MLIVEYQGTTWELNDEVAVALIAEGIVEKDVIVAPSHKAGNHALTDEFHNEWSPKTHEAFCLAVAIFQAAEAIEEGSATAESESARDNLTDAVVILKGGRV